MRATASDDSRPDLAAMLHRLARVVVDREQPLLDRHGLTMWEYVVLSGLHAGAAPTQAQLARLVGRDQTRLIPILDTLQARGLVDRRPDPADRRNRAVTLTDAGRTLLGACRGSIREMEDDLLAGLPARERQVVVSALLRLCADTGALALGSISPSA